MLTYMEPLQQEHEEKEEEVQVVVAATEDSGAMEEQSVNLLDSGGEEVEGEEQDYTGEEDENDDDDDDDDGSETLVPPPPKPALAPFLPLYTNKHPFNKPLRGNRRPLHNRKLYKNLQKRPANNTPPPHSEEDEDINTQVLMDFSTQAHMDATRSNFTDQRMPASFDNWL